jgi:hypothetical protein
MISKAGGFGLPIAGIGTVPSHLGSQECIVQGDLPNTAKGVLNNAHHRLVGFGRDNLARAPVSRTCLMK